MTRFLSESLQAREPFFQMELRKLERSRGNPGADISLSAQLQQGAQLKLKQLGLDPTDTTGVELYHTLQQRMKADDARLVKTLRTRAATHVSAEGDIVAGMVHALHEAPLSHSGLSLKSTSFKALIKKNPPKRTMKRLGYRSLDSFLKHESPALILAAAKIAENDAWHKSMLEFYKKLQPRDFETKRVTIAHPDSKKWHDLARSAVAEARHNVISLPVLGAVVILPLPHDVPPGVTTASLAFALQSLNDVKSASTFLKVSLMRRDFGSAVQRVAKGMPKVQTDVFGQKAPWHIVQRYYERLQHLFKEELFEPHIQIDDMSLPMIEQFMSFIEPAMEFWHESAALAVLADHQPVSLNVMDAALNLCNQVPFEKRIVSYFQQSLWYEIIIKYIGHETVESAVVRQLQPEFEVAV